MSQCKAVINKENDMMEKERHTNIGWRFSRVVMQLKNDGQNN